MVVHAGRQAAFLLSIWITAAGLPAMALTGAAVVFWGPLLWIAAAVLADRTGPYLVFRVLPSAVRKLHRWVLRRWSGLVRAVTGEEYLPRPGLEQAVDDQHFGLYADHPNAEKGIVYSLAFGLLLTGLGLVFAIAFVFLRR